jgi:hypothetical protein
MALGGKAADRPTDLAPPRYPQVPRNVSVTEFPGARGYSMEELNTLVRNHVDNGAPFVPAPELADSAYHGSHETFSLDNAFFDTLQLPGYGFPCTRDLDISDSESNTGHKQNMDLNDGEEEDDGGGASLRVFAPPEPIY